ncbi:unnamed protein product, partial [Musa hybrid cultivar]
MTLFCVEQHILYNMKSKSSFGIISFLLHITDMFFYRKKLYKNLVITRDFFSLHNENLASEWEFHA